MIINNINTSEPIGNIVSRNFRTADVFYRLGIDFCCGGKKTLSRGCSEKSINLEQTVKELEMVFENEDGLHEDYTILSAELLIQLIVEKHHNYVRQNEAVLTQYLNKIRNVHGARHPELSAVLEHFIASISELVPHMNREENIVFPAIKNLLNPDITSDPSDVENVQKMLETLMTEHDTEGERFKKIAELTNNFTVPADGCTTYRVAFDKLMEFEKNLHKHIHLENNILFPRVLTFNKAVEPAGTSCCLL